MTATRSRSLMDFALDVLIDRALSPAKGERTNLERLAAELGVSRTPVREALVRLELVGLYEVPHQGGVRMTFAGPRDIAARAQLLAGAIRAGSTPDGLTTAKRVSTCVGGHWGDYAIRVITRWPAHACAWGIDLRPAAARMDAVWAEFEEALTEADRDGAARAMRAWEQAATAASIASGAHRPVRHPLLSSSAL